MSLCKECNNNVFGGGYCKYHQYRRSMQGGDKYSHKPKIKKRKKIPRESAKRKEETPYYKQVKDELREDMIANDTYNCFFCTKPMGNEKGFHHTKGRDGTLFTDRKYLKPGHNDCHVRDYHQSTVAQMLKQTWYQGFLIRLKELDEKLYEAEIKKQSKSELNFK